MIRVSNHIQSEALRIAAEMQEKGLEQMAIGTTDFLVVTDQERPRFASAWNSFYYNGKRFFITWRTG